MSNRPNPNNRGPIPVQKPIQVDTKTLNSLHCSTPMCLSPAFNRVFLLFEVPAILSPTGQVQVIDVPAFMCVKCGAVWASPVQLKHMTPDMRETARVLEEVQRQNRADDGDINSGGELS